MDNPPRYVSGQSLFSMVEEQLASGKRVRFPVSGTSMTPWIIHNRDQIELISAKGLRLKKGDIILFQPFSGKYILHRITKIVPSGYITTGDGNLYRDGFTSSASVIGKVVTIHRKGKPINCSAPQWRILSWLWMALFPFRRWMLAWLTCIRKCMKKADILAKKL